MELPRCMKIWPELHAKNAFIMTVNTGSFQIMKIISFESEFKVNWHLKILSLTWSVDSEIKNINSSSLFSCRWFKYRDWHTGVCLVQEYIDLLMPPLINKWNVLKDTDKDLFPLLEVSYSIFRVCMVSSVHSGPSCMYHVTCWTLVTSDFSEKKHSFRFFSTYIKKLRICLPDTWNYA